MRRIELHAAYSWDCDECGVENFEGRPVIETQTQREKERALRGKGRLKYDVLAPVIVYCGNCGAEYEAEFEPAGVE